MKYKYMKSEYHEKDSTYIYYFELDEEGIMYRPITVTNEMMYVSNRPYECVHFCLSEKPVDFNAECTGWRG